MDFYAYDLSALDFSLNFPDPYGEPFSRLRASAAIPTTALRDDCEDIYRPKNVPARPSGSPPKHRHDGLSPLPLGMDWSPPPRKWDGRDSLWPHDPATGWSYCVTIPSWSSLPTSSGSDPAVFYRVQVGLQSPEGVTTVREISRRFNEFLELFFELKKAFPKKHLPPAPPKKALRMKNKTFYEERRSSLEEWMERLLADIDISRSVSVANFLELEAAVRSFFNEVANHWGPDDVSSNNVMVPPLPETSPTTSIAAASLIASSQCDDTCHEASELGAPRYGDEDNSELMAAENADDLSLGRASKVIKPGIENLSGDTFFDHPEGHESPRGKRPTSGTGWEDLVADLNREVASRQLLEAKVKDLELELETAKIISKENMQLENLNEKEKFFQPQLDMEELKMECREMDMELESEGQQKPQTEPTKISCTEENIMLLRGLDASREQLENLQKQYEEFETKSKEDVKLLVEEVKSLRGIQLDLKQEFSHLVAEKLDLERVLQAERQRMDHASISTQKLLHDCEILHNHLQDTTVDFLVDKEDQFDAETSTSDAIDRLAASDTRIGLLLSEAGKLLEQDLDDVDDAVLCCNGLRKILKNVLLDNARLRMQVNSVTRRAVNGNGTAKKDEEDESI